MCVLTHTQNLLLNSTYDINSDPKAQQLDIMVDLSEQESRMKSKLQYNARETHDGIVASVLGGIAIRYG